MRILVVEDNKEIASFLKTSLEAECFAVDVAEDGEQGTYLGRINAYDAIILDNILPKKLGKDVCIAIKEKNKDVPILMLSVKADVPTKVEMLNIGADDYMAKPFSFSELLARIKAILRRPKGAVSEIMSIGDIALDTTKHQVKIKDEEIHLTRKEFMLLELLMKRNGEVVSRGEISEHVWDMNLDPFSNTIEAHVRNLRKKLSLDCDNKDFLLTVPGRGYRIKC
ncbi:MAG: response regulator transcription factor [Candidatus Moranbacteria bacterium]|nr:response regulator transcription factor [Candidatus Moranbacteria bacterium]